MKIRIRGNSIRLRLTQSEVKQFEETGEILDKIQFGTQELIYGLSIFNGSQAEVSYQPNIILVKVPEKEGNHWAATDQVGIEYSLKLNGDSDLKILIEKDFQCLKVRSGGEDADTFPNPEAG